jgi:hypothetical protein
MITKSGTSLTHGKAWSRRASTRLSQLPVRQQQERLPKVTAMDLHRILDSRDLTLHLYLSSPILLTFEGCYCCALITEVDRGWRGTNVCPWYPLEPCIHQQGCCFRLGWHNHQRAQGCPLVVQSCAIQIARITSGGVSEGSSILLARLSTCWQHLHRDCHESTARGKGCDSNARVEIVGGKAARRCTYLGEPSLLAWLIYAMQIPDVPFHIFAAIARDGFRKPMPGIWHELEHIFRGDGVTIGANSSNDFYKLSLRLTLHLTRQRCVVFCG